MGRLKKIGCVYIISLVLIFIHFCPDAFAGLLVAPSIKWCNFSFRPLENEPTPNYYGYGAGLNLGYSVKQAIDVGIYAQYVPATLKTAKLLEEDASLMFYGFEIGFRISEAVFLGGYYGVTQYHLLKQDDDDELPGTYQGMGGGLKLGAIYTIDKSMAWQIALEAMHASLKNTKDSEEPGRFLDSFALSVTFVFNEFKNYFVKNPLLKGFLNVI